MLVEALVTQAAVEALHEAILRRFARRYVLPLDVMPVLPGEDRIDRCTELVLDSVVLARKTGAGALGRPALVTWGCGWTARRRSSTCVWNGRQYLDSSNRNPKSTAVTRNRIESPYLQL